MWCMLLGGSTYFYKDCLGSFWIASYGALSLMCCFTLFIGVTACCPLFFSKIFLNWSRKSVTLFGWWRYFSGFYFVYFSNQPLHGVFHVPFRSPGVPQISQLLLGYFLYYFTPFLDTWHSLIYYPNTRSILYKKLPRFYTYKEWSRSTFYKERHKFIPYKKLPRHLKVFLSKIRKR